MRLVGRLKEEVEKAETAEKKKELIEEAGMELDDEELEQVSGGLGNLKNPIVYIGKAL
ncbi:MAG: class IIb bacteriocin, lactobin A/cerein 7B family [Lachnospiraceae bacterium]|jgi:bacteriocin-like protein